jgi:hypothetical protein
MSLTVGVMRKLVQRMAFYAIALMVIAVAGCVSTSPPVPSHSMSWQGLEEGETVYGIVKLTVRIDGNGPAEVRFYLDNLDSEHLIGVASLESSSLYASDWYTQDVANGDHVLYAVSSFGEGNPSQVSTTINVNNKSRAGSIPAGAIKLTPQNDPAPPQLAPAFREYWHDPVPLEGPINTAGAEDSPFVTPDGQTLYFWFNGDQSKDVQEQARDPLTGIYWCKKVNGEWQEPERLFLQYYDKLGLDGAPTVRGNTLWFASIREGNYRNIDIWTAELVNGRWTHWANVGELLNKTYDLGELHVTADGNEIYYGSTRPGGKGQSDIWVTRRVNGQWQEPENVDAVNTDGSEGQPFVSEDGNELWFTRSTPGPTIYRSVKREGKWQEPELVVSHLSGEPTLDSNGNLYFTHLRWDDTLNRVTEADIYVCYRK